MAPPDRLRVQAAPGSHGRGSCRWCRLPIGYRDGQTDTGQRGAPTLSEDDRRSRQRGPDAVGGFDVTSGQMPGEEDGVRCPLAVPAATGGLERAGDACPGRAGAGGFPGANAP